MTTIYLIVYMMLSGSTAYTMLPGESGAETGCRYEQGYEGWSFCIYDMKRDSPPQGGGRPVW